MDLKNEKQHINEQYIKDAILAEYTSLMNLIIKRTDTTSSIIYWLIVLTGAFIGLFVNNYYFNSKEFSFLAFISVGYIITVELLISFWIYQIYEIFRISIYINHLKIQYTKYFNIKIDVFLCWEGYEKLFKKNDVSVIIRYLQPVSLYVMALLGIIILSIIILVFTIWNILNIFLFLIPIIFSYFLYYLYKIHSKLQNWKEQFKVND